MGKRQTVKVVGSNVSFRTMFERRGWTLVEDINKASLVQFTGGADVSPNLYNQARHTSTYANPTRDAEEVEIFKQARSKEIPMAGVCRGGQFLNVMCGGSMYQDVDRHSGAQHLVFDLVAELDFLVTSAHHQMMIPGTAAKILLVAWEATFREKMSTSDKNVVIRINRGDYHPDIEALAYPKLKVLCYQPHPEYPVASKVCVDRYFDYIKFYCQ